MLKTFSIFLISFLISHIATAETPPKVNYQQGVQYGSCFQELNAGFQVITSRSLTYPMVKCPSSGTGIVSQPQCAPGFTVFVKFFSQGNTGSTGGYNDLLDYYWKATTCIKN